MITSKISKATIAVATLMTAAVMALGGLQPVGAVGEYQCGTYGGGSYNETDCTDPTPTQSSSSGSSGTSSGTTSTSTNSSSSSTSKSTTTTTTSTTTPPLLNDFSEYVSETGKTLPIKVGDVIYFNLGGEKHTITVKSITASKLVVTIASTPTDVSVPAGQTTNYDVDQDGTADIAIAYTDFSSATTTANANFKSLVATVEETPVTTGAANNGSAGGTTVATTDKSANLGWLWVIPAIVGAALLAGAIVVIRKRKAAANTGTNFTQY